MNSKLIGGILLVIGTTIGAGMLALPTATALLGFWGSIVLFVASWVLITACAYLFLEVNLWLPADNNLVSMAGATLGKAGQALAWIIYLILLYSLIAAYVSGGGDLFHYVLHTAGLPISQGLASILFTILLGSVVYCGIQLVDYVNRFLMFGKMGAYILAAILLVPFVTLPNLNAGHLIYLSSANAITVSAVAFGSLMIIPSLRSYFGGDIKSLRIAIFVGGFIPLLCYILWDMVICGIIPLHGATGLAAMAHSTNSNSDIVAALTALVQKNSIIWLVKFFVSICMMTSFLSISLCLSDFLADGLRMKKHGVINKFVIALLTFLPPLATVLFYPDAFMRGLNYAGITIIILMVLLPPLMVWRGRYHHAVSTAHVPHQIGGGKPLLVILLIIAALLIGCGLEGVLPHISHNIQYLPLALAALAALLMLGYTLIKSRIAMQQ